MKKFFKNHIGLIIFLIILVVFPVSLSNQVKLNMRVIVTGIAIDKVDEIYEVTAQIVNANPGSESPGQSAELDFLTDSGETISKALENLMYKTGKVSAYSHTSFVILGKDVLDEDVTKALDVFVRDKIIKNSALILFAKDKAKDEIKKTKDLDLSVGLGLQKVYTFKQEESNGLMVTILDFLNNNKMYGKTSVASVLEFEDGSSGGSSSSGSESGSLGGSSSEGSESGQSSSNTSFKTNSMLKCFVDGNFVFDLEDEDEISGYMFSTNRAKSCNIELKDFESEELKDVKITVIIRDKSIRKKIRFENELPCLDLEILIKNSEINEVLSEKIFSDFSDEEYKEIETVLRKKIAEMLSGTFEKAKDYGADIYEAYEIAYKFNYDDLKKYYDFNVEEFVKNLKLNVKVSIHKLDY